MFLHIRGWALLLILALSTFGKSLAQQGCKEGFKDNLTRELEYYELGSESYTVQFNLNHHYDSIVWRFPDIRQSIFNTGNPIINFQNDGIYDFEVEVHLDGCYQVLKKEIEITSDKELVLPNAISPNGDAINDILKINASMYKNFGFFIYDRRGHQIFEGYGEDVQWDPTQGNHQAGTYVYLMKALTQQETLVTKTGTITLIN